MDNAYAVIMAGGGGTRLWPMSRKNKPKQLLPLIENDTLFQATVKRLEGLLPGERILVVTVVDQVAELRKQAPEIPAENFLIEPEPKGTAAVVGLAASILQLRDPESVMIILPADHYIRNRDLFYHVLRIAKHVAEKDYLVTLGITPTHASTGYGYIERGEDLPEDFSFPVYRVKSFQEKPQESVAHELIRTGKHYWNSGMFIWKSESIIKEFALQMPELKLALDKIVAAVDKPGFEDVLQKEWETLKPETIDYGIMEKAENIAIVPASGLEWSDVGSWDSLFEVLLPDHDGNIVFSSHHNHLDTHNSLIYGNNNGRLVVTIGVDDLIIVDTSDVLLICHKEHTQKVRQAVNNLKNSDTERYL